jgi:SAM-dependent methyltransferase
MLLSPLSGIARLAPVNFHNARVCAGLRIHCPVCGNTAKMDYDFPDTVRRKAHGIGLLRETLACRCCGASMRNRQLAIGVLGVVEDIRGSKFTDLRELKAASQGDLKILDTDSFSPLNRLLRGMRGYCHSQYRPDLPGSKQLADGSLNVNLLAMPFEPNCFDIVMTSDVMEHVAKDELAHREIFRCLKPRGAYVFTVPYDDALAATRRLTVSSGKDESMFFQERHVHGDPHSAGGIVAHRIYGQSFQREMADIGYEMRFFELQDPLRGIFGGDLFVARKRA